MNCREDETLDDLLRDNLRVVQGKKGYRFSVDAVLLAAFATLGRGSQVCELGAGSGVISVLLVQRDKSCSIKALEVQDSLWDRAVRTVKLNGLEDNIEVIKGDIRRVREIFPAGGFDLVVANPPFWRIGEGLLPEDPEVAAACHEVVVTLEEVIGAAAYLLRLGGKLALIQRAARLDEVIRLSHQYRVPVKRIRMVHPHQGRPANLVLTEGTKGAKPGVTVLSPLVIYEDTGIYTSEVISLYYGEER
ncbi:MAG TPA: tRNA1(Val) (adenine(37)-N6)-methyltransferase [Syntrophothermus lipocalidus]|uniref:Methyltransferase small n=1 Tax=Syntrophothermus lipocalidus (strain DSM 12680 / TGB-C1) TaxID=643648 RepID=D7CIJ3_SYNLT|nr:MULTISPECIES: tRNA1(Val) (adenine(37)-N6)-methyltransferase [Syntrophothermus]ADI00858.1 methyltransferase small [Syntrophothermus lipocalidus DSM 12680]NSW83372.1 tRNA1(Val) (adenine(37)-N6)-methyltransferase [Syntrophothermus sp.]HHV76928.1 tRNA1(Val) (adenine(37)-N6)-methyltransferase [Syntrophothermus lipocalidus]